MKKNGLLNAVICLGLYAFQLGCQVDIKDKNADAPVEPFSGFQAFSKDESWQLDKTLELERDTEIEAYSFELKSTARIITHGYSLRIKSFIFKSQGAIIETFTQDEVLRRVRGNDEKPSLISIEAQEAHGLLTVYNRGLPGANGKDFASWEWPDLGQAGRGPAAVVDIKSLGVVRKNGESQIKEVTYCRSRNDGLPGEITGADAIPGENGQPGADTANLIFKQSSKGSLVVRLYQQPGAGGLGGRASQPQRGQRGGPPGADVDNICKGQRGPDASSGKPAVDGQPGAMGNVSEVQLYQVQLI